MRLLSCPCGESVTVAAVQAGETVRCGCGGELAVPVLDGYLYLPFAPAGERRRLSPAAEYRDWLRHLTPRLRVVPAVLLVNLLVFAGMCADGASPVRPDADAAIRWGALSGPGVADGEVWRLVTAGFVHYGAFHLLANAAFLLLFGRLVERLYGPAGFLGLYLAAVVAGSVGSLLGTPAGGAAGASAGVGGMMAAGLVLLLRVRDSAPRRAGRSAAWLMVLVVLQTFGDVVGLFAGPRPGGWRIDHAGHLGGLLVGIGVGLLARRPVPARPPLSRRRAVALLLVTLTFAVAGWGWATFASGWARAFVEYDRQMRAADAAYREGVEAWERAGAGDLLPLADVIDREVLPPLRAGRAALADPGRVPASQAAVLDDLRRHGELLAEAYTKMAAACRSGAAADMDAANAALEAASAFHTAAVARW